MEKTIQMQIISRQFQSFNDENNSEYKKLYKKLIHLKILNLLMYKTGIFFLSTNKIMTKEKKTKKP